MQFLRTVSYVCFFFVFAFQTIYGQPYQEETCLPAGEAYTQSCYNSHWSALVPVALIVGAAIWFGVADGNSNSDSSNSHDGLGSLASRRSSSSYGGSHTHSSRYSSSYHSH